MRAGEVFLIIFFNCLIFAGFYYAYIRVMERRLQHLKSEIQELEDLVAAIIEEFEEVAAINVKQYLAVSESAESEENAEIPGGIRNVEPVTTVLSPSEPIAEVNPSKELTERAKPQDESPAKMIQVMDPRHQRIVELWKNGIPVEEIARQLGTGRGEVQLVLGIYQKL